MPLLGRSCLVAAILLAHLQDEFDGTFKGAAKDQTAVWRIAPWIVLFLQCWMVSVSAQMLIYVWRPSPDPRRIILIFRNAASGPLCRRSCFLEIRVLCASLLRRSPIPRSSWSGWPPPSVS